MATPTAPINYMYKPVQDGVKKIETGVTNVKPETKPPAPALLISMYTVVSGQNIHHIHAYVNKGLQFKINIDSPIVTTRQGRRTLLEKYNTTDKVSEEVAIQQLTEWLGRFNTKSVLLGDYKDLLLVHEKLKQYNGFLPVANRIIDMYTYFSTRTASNMLTFKLPKPDDTTSLWEFVDAYVRNPPVK